ncbi:MAG TPA: ABC transporter permease subunit/CPBP intramembrane protease [Polyangia bacterium]|nr:ABC transporter permease subunit/CPBP intramembrane protease [Polyangia bacterium]
MKLREVRLVAGKELRETLRDRRTLAVMVLFPLVVYPLVSLVTAQVLAARAARVEAHVARVAVSGPPALAAELGRRLASPEVTVVPAAGAAAARAALGDGRIDAAAEVAPGHPPAVRLAYDETREESSAARDRVEHLLEAPAAGRCAPDFTVAAVGIARRAKVSGYVLSKVLPLVVVVMVMLGAFHPAIDITAGERERSTLETTLSAPIDRAALMAGKVLAVATLATLTGVLNLASMSLTVLEGTRLVGSAANLTIPWVQAALAFAVVPPTAFLFASVMVAIGALARSFKEAQTLLTPVYFLCMAPALAAGLGDFRLGAGTAFVPGVGVTLLARDLILGRASLVMALAVLASTALYGAAALALAARLYDSERLFFTDEASLGLGAWLRHVVSGRAAAPAGNHAAPAADEPPTAGHAIALYGIACVLLFFVFVPLETWRLEPGLLVSEWAGLGGLTWLYARGRGQPLRQVLRLRAPTPTALSGAALVGLSAWLVIGLLAESILPAPKEVVENLRRAIAPPGGGRGLPATLFLMALTPAICEEALFRGPILRGLRARFSPAAAAILTGLLFGIYHLDAWRLIPTALLGVALSGIALASDSILPAMAAHFLNNASLIVLARLHADDTATLAARTKLFLGTLGALVLGLGIYLLSRAAKTRRGM